MVVATLKSQTAIDTKTALMNVVTKWLKIRFIRKTLRTLLLQKLLHFGTNEVKKKEVYTK